MLSVTELSGGYATADQVVKSVSLKVRPGEILTIIGPNGAGKSTALKLIAGLLQIRSGDVQLSEESITTLKPEERARRGLVFVPQEQNTFGTLTISENLEMGAYLEPAAARERAAGIYERFPVLSERRRTSAGSLSGGQRQTLALAIALMTSPRVLLLDEPTAALAPKAAEEIFGVIRALADGGLAILMVEQNALAALSVSDRGYVMVDGRRTMEGDAQSMRADPDVRRAFLGGRI